MLARTDLFPLRFSTRSIRKERDQIPREPRLTPNSAASLSSLRDIIKLNGLKLRYIYILKTKVPRFLKKSDSKKLKVSLRNINGSRPESHREAKFGVEICLRVICHPPIRYFFYLSPDLGIILFTGITYTLVAQM